MAFAGPLVNTYCDFWRMVWLERAEFIVMLTRSIENGKVTKSLYLFVRNKLQCTNKL